MPVEAGVTQSGAGSRAGRRHVGLLALILLAGLAGRAWLAFVVAPGRGYAGDMASFLTWSRTIARTGPGGFYAADPGANYPPVSILMFWGLDTLSRPVAAFTGDDQARALLLLLKVPAVLADVVTAALAYGLTTRWRGPRAGLVAAALYLAVPPVWYVSALWGQIDAVLTVFSLATLACVVTGRTYLATALAVLAVLVKPQGILVVLVVGVVLLASLVRRDAFGRRHIGRLLGSLATGAAVGLALVVPFDYEALAGPRTASIPVVGDVAGLLAQSVSTGQLFPVLTADAYNPWALVGDRSLAHSVSTGTAIWQRDSLPFAGTSAGVIGLVALLVAVVAVVVGLVRRHDLPAVLLGYTMLSYAFFVLPTRVHERYLLPAFATGVVLAAPVLWRVCAYVAASLLHAINLHAILAPGLSLVVTGPGGSRAPVGGPPAGGPPTGLPRVPRRGAPSDTPQNLPLPFADLSRAEWVVQLVSVGQTLVLLGLVVAWVVTLRRRPPS